MPVDLKQEKLSKAKVILEKTKKFLDELAEDQSEITFKEFLEAISTEEENYYDALQIAIDGQSVILKRQVKERYVNSYNPLFLLKWQANIDVQLVSLINLLNYIHIFIEL